MGHLHASAALLWERLPAPEEQEAGWASELFWAFWKREKSLIPAGIRTPVRPPRGIVCTPTTLSLLNRNEICFKEHPCAQRAHIMISDYF
jgi:hypothetical protein